MAVRPVPSDPDVTRRMQATRRRDTPAELALRSRLHSLGYRYRVDVSPIVGVRRRADVVFPRARVAVYVDGCFWHGCPQHGTWPKANAEWWSAKLEANRRRDRDTDSELAARGWRVVRVWEHERVGDAVARVTAVVDEALGRDDYRTSTACGASWSNTTRCENQPSTSGEPS
jgi:DNA mismatch endonuclease, patch repair protein